MANTKKKTNDVKKEDTKETKKTTSKVATNKEKKLTNTKNNSSKKKATKRKSYADEMKVDMSLQTKTTIMTIFTVILVLVTFYVITIYATGGKMFKSKDKTDVEFQYSEILLGRSFDMGGNYFVIYYDKTDTENEETTQLDSLASNFKNNSSGAAIYTCDLGNVFNKPYTTTEEPNTEPYGAEDMLINGPTIIRFADGKVVEYVYGYDNVVNYINGYNPEQ